MWGQKDYLIKMNLVLIGYRGTGKSSVAKLIAEKMHAKLISTDELIVKKAGMSIPKIVERKGWEHFLSTILGMLIPAFLTISSSVEISLACIFSAINLATELFPVPL